MARRGLLCAPCLAYHAAMSLRAALLAGCPPAIEGAVQAELRDAGYSVSESQPACALLNLDAESEPETIIDRSERFAASAAAGASIITLIHSGGDWRAARRFACVSAFTRHFARDWAARGIRLNALCIGADGPAGWNGTAHDAGAVASLPATPRDIARVLVAMLGFPSMTGQLVRLGGS